MAKEFKGDINVRRAIVVGRRSDEGLKDLGALAGNYAVLKQSHAWITADPNGLDRDMTLPDATTLDVGWQTVIHNNGTADNLNVKDNGGTSQVLAEFGSAVELTLVDNGTAAGVWYVEDLNDEGKPRFVIISGKDKNSGVGTFLEFFKNNGSDAMPYIVAEISTIKALSVIARSASTCTLTINVNGVPITSISLVAGIKNSIKDLEFALSIDDEIDVEITSGTFNRGNLYISIRVDE